MRPKKLVPSVEELFAKHARKHKGRAYPYLCACGVKTPLRTRITRNKRYCPACGKPIITISVDVQVAYDERLEQEARAIGRMLTAAVFIILSFVVLITCFVTMAHKH